MFFVLDTLLTLHKRKCDLFKNIKKSLLEKMFPKNGSVIPEVRFKGFTDAWEQRKLGEVAVFRRGLTYKLTDISNKGIRVLRSSNIEEDRFMLQDEDTYVDLSAINIEYAKDNDILITAANGSSRLVGKHALIRGIADDSTVHGGFMLLASSEVPGFLNALMSTNWYATFIGTYTTGGNGALGNLKKTDLEEQIVLIADREENSRVGSIPFTFDNLITLHQRKVEKLQNIKKALLEKMFV
jgi:type I restriction enzyme S subunit